MTEGKERPVRMGAVAWVLIVVVVGLVAGLLISYASPHRSGPPPPGAPPPGPANFGGAAIVLSTVCLSLLLALLFVYLRTFSQTRARFALGLVVFLAALFVQTLAGSPALFVALGTGPGSLGSFFFVSSLFEAVALTVFLFLSLE